MVILVLLLPLVFLVVSLCGLVVVLMGLVKSRRTGFLHVIMAAMRRGLPLGPVIKAYAEDCSGFLYKVQVTKVALAMDAGKTLPQALRTSPGVLNAEEIALLNHLALGSVSEDVLDDLFDKRRRNQQLMSDVFDRVSTIATSAISCVIIIGTCNFFILPRIEHIMRDFGVEVPQITKLFIYLWDHSTGLAGPVVLLLIVAIGWRWFRRQRLPRAHSVGDVVLLLRDISTLIETARPIESSLDRLSQAYGDSRVGLCVQSLRRVHEKGLGLAKSLHAAGFVDQPSSDLLIAAERVGNFPWACREIALKLERRETTRARKLFEGISILLLLFIAIVVLLFAASYVLPLVQMIENML